MAAVGQAIMQAARPRAIIAPLQLGLGLQMHHHFASKFLIETLNNLGFSSSYSEVMLYERNAAVTADPNNNTLSCGQFIQYTADDIDHNLRTIDGKNTFHGMGIISCITPEHKEIRTIARRTNVSLAEIVDLSHINIKFYSPQNTHIDDVIFTYLPDPEKDINSCNIDLLWNVSWLLHPNTPLWSGAMQLIQKGVYPGKSTINLLPMIDLEPTDLSCIYSTLHFISMPASNTNAVPILTFDQPLWQKAYTIIRRETESSCLQNIVLRLGPFHLQMRKRVEG